MKKLNVGILPMLFAAIALGAITGRFAPDFVMRLLNSFSRPSDSS